jgi:hypothetical protein
MLGHSKINTNLYFHSHMLPDMQREAADRLDMMLHLVQPGNESEQGGALLPKLLTLLGKH